MVRLDAELKFGKRGAMVPSWFPGLSFAFALAGVLVQRALKTRK